LGRKTYKMKLIFQMKTKLLMIKMTSSLCKKMV